MRAVPSHIALSLLASLAAPGCGLVLDVDPPDPQRTDGGGIDGGVVPERDGGAPDAGTSMDAAPPGDGGERPDATPPTDALVRPDAPIAIDARVGVDAATPRCRTSSDCAEGEYCARPRGSCYGEGDCLAIPMACLAVADPVCGCDWEAHGNPCEAAMRGSNVMQEGACPVRTFGTEWCSLAPTAPADPGGCARCFDDSDCGGLAPICVGSSCRAGGEGLCALGPPPAGDCYDGRQCRDTERCVGSAIDVCIPRQGVCDAP